MDTKTKIMYGLKIAKVRKVKTPTRGTDKSAGIDFYVPDDIKPIHLHPGDDALIPSGIKVKMREGVMLTAFNKSSISIKRKLQVGASIIDQDYQGELHLHVFNIGSYATTINPGDKLVQFILIPVFYDEILEVPVEDIVQHKTDRGEGKFGSTGS